MDAWTQLADELTEWCERLMVKGLAKFDPHDLDELHTHQDSARELDMLFLAEVIDQLATAGARYVRDSRADVEELARRYFFLSQYVEIAGVPKEENQP